MRKITAAAAALLMATTSAQAQDFDGDRVLRTFERADFLATLAEIDAVATPMEGQNNLRLEFANGMKANGVLMACDDDATEANCYATSILATFRVPEGIEPAELFKALNEYNYRENFGRAFVDAKGSIQVRMYIISDGGITMENYRRQMLLWTNSAADFFSYLYGED